MTDLACFINPIEIGQTVIVEFGTRQPMRVTAVTESRVCVRYPNLVGVRWYPLADVLRWNPELDRPAPAPKPERPMRELATFMPEYAPLLPAGEPVTWDAPHIHVKPDDLRPGDVVIDNRFCRWAVLYRCTTIIRTFKVHRYMVVGLDGAHRGKRRVTEVTDLLAADVTDCPRYHEAKHDMARKPLRWPATRVGPHGVPYAPVDDEDVA